MSVTGLHPEHLLEKESMGTLDDAERKQLDAHLGQCAACRFERSVRADFADELEGDDPPVRISGLLIEAGVEKKKEPRPIVRRARLRFTWLVAAAVLLLVATAVASEQGRRVLMPIFGIRTVTVVVTAPAPTNPPPAPTMAHWAPVDPPPVASTPAPEPTNEAVVPVVVTQTSQTIFDQESDARRRGDYERAIALHSELVTKYPQSKEAQVSRVTVARMLLDRGDASSALVGFDAYLRNGGGELAEEAMLGRATALDRLGRNDEALAAWKALLEKQPDGPYAAHAQVRIEALSSSP